MESGTSKGSFGTLQKNRCIKPPLDLEEDVSTDAPSCSSDVENTCSSDAGGSDSCADDERQGNTLRFARNLPLHAIVNQKGMEHLGRTRLSAARRTKQWSATAQFKKTPLDPIPGTPVGMSEHPPLLFPPQECSESNPEELLSTLPNGHSATQPSKSRAPTTGQPLYKPRSSKEAAGVETHRPCSRSAPQVAWKALLATLPEKDSTPSSGASWLPSSPKRRARNAVIQKAKQDGTPLKVSMLHGGMDAPRKLLDPTVPAKKKPILQEAGPGVSTQYVVRSLEPGVPVKKRITAWLVVDPVRVLPATPR
jgi:hypothetical protein